MQLWYCLRIAGKSLGEIGVDIYRQFVVRGAVYGCSRHHQFPQTILLSDCEGIIIVEDVLGGRDDLGGCLLLLFALSLLAEENREAFLRQYLPEEFGDYFDLLTDFRCSGYRILGDLVCDCMDAYRLEDQRKLHSEQDSPAMTAMLDAYLNRASGTDYKTAVALECRKQLESIVKASEAVKYAVAIKDKDFLWDVLYDKIYTHVKRMEVSRDAE